MNKLSYADGLLEAMKIVAEASGSLKMWHFSAETWEMLQTINRRLSEAALKAQQEPDAGQRCR